MKDDYLPHKEAELLLWHDTFRTGVTTHGSGLGLAPTDVTAIGTDNEDLHSDVTASAAADEAAKSATSTKKTTIKRVSTNARLFAQRMKKHPNYTEAIGHALGIIGAEDSTDLSTSKPTLTGKAMPGALVELGFDKSISEGVNIYCRRDGETGPVFLARDTCSPYVDNRPLLVARKPETREYRAIYVVADEQIGEMSDELVITVAP